jgi:hypothetical protein
MAMHILCNKLASGDVKAEVPSGFLGYIVSRGKPGLHFTLGKIERTAINTTLHPQDNNNKK